MQTFVVTMDSRFIERYTHGIRLACSAAFSIPSVLCKFQLETGQRPASIFIEICLLLLILVASLSIPRRPTVVHHGKTVDRQFSVSLLDRLTFAWGPFHQAGVIVPTVMKMEDLPQVGHTSRLRSIKETFETDGGAGELWQQLIRAFWSTILRQWMLVFVTASSQFGSRFALFKLLQALEMRTELFAVVWVWVLGLGLGLLVEAFSKSWLVWVTQMRLQIPIEGLLKAFVFEKTTRKKLGSRISPSKNTKAGEQASQEKLSLTDVITNDWYEHHRLA